jgi:ubiquinone/menaquinone biosynthesis C-methylase UbiE
MPSGRSHRRLGRYVRHPVRSWPPAARHYALLRQLNHRITTAVPESTPNELFGELDDPTWLWVNKSGYRRSRLLREVLPSLPPATVQRRFTGRSGDSTLNAGFRAYRLFKELYKDSVGEISTADHLLDFGCGWGRVIRFFLKDVDPSALYGVDPARPMIELCEETNRWCRFSRIDEGAPTSFPDGMFDLIFANSVFSHLSEEIHKAWLGEFRRILKPGGLVIATTRPREYIETRDAMRAQLPESMKDPTLPPAFPDPQRYLAAYDAGEYVHSHLSHPPTATNFGETCIPKAYVLEHWTKCLDFSEFIAEPRRFQQNVIVMRK